MFLVLLCPCEYKTCKWQVKLCDRIKHGALLECFEDLRIIKYAIQVLLLHYITLHYNVKQVALPGVESVTADTNCHTTP